ncbi:MAG: ABC transporter permease [Candidatus Limnocylindria bacterium]
MIAAGELHSMLALAQRDLTKLLRDRARLIATIIVPFIFIGALGGTLAATFGRAPGFDSLTLTFTGVYALTLFQSTAMGMISLVIDRENDFSQELFIAPVSRYTIVAGRILGETLVALPQALAIIAFGLVIGIHISPAQLALLIGTGLVVAFFGGAFGVLILAFLNNQRAANQVFAFIFLPQFLLAGVFTPIQAMPWYIEIASRITPLRYAVDFVRGAFYAGSPDYSRVVLQDPGANLEIIVPAFVVCLVVGTFFFVRSERNR